MVVCRFYQQGRCTKGDTCSFEHPSTSTTTSVANENISITSHSLSTDTARKDVLSVGQPCVFYRQGICKRGVFCRYDHDVQVPPAASSGIAQTTPQIPMNIRIDSTPASHEDARSNIACAFFLRNACNKGVNCPFSHEQNPGKASIDESAPLVAEALNKSDLKGSSRLIGGATVTFGEGAMISVISLPRDSSTISMSNIPLQISAREICTRLESFGVPSFSPESIKLRLNPQKTCQSAQISVHDADFATQVIKKVGTTMRFGESSVSVNIVHSGGASDAGTNRLQLTTVSCTWHNPSKTGSLEYWSYSDARKIIAWMHKRAFILHGRRLTFVHNHSLSPYIKVGNIDVRTTKRDLQTLLPKPLPEKLVLGKSSHLETRTELEEQVRASLLRCGVLNDWTVTSKPTDPKAKAFAKFADPEDARKAVKTLDGTRIDPVSRDKTHVQLVVSVKMSVARQVIDATRPQLNALIEQAWKSDYVSIKTYYQSEKAYTPVRVFGSNKEAVARAKSSVEKLFEGHIATNDGNPISDAFFFQKEAANMLDNLSKTHGVVITQDRRKMMLRLYGSEDKIDLVQQALIAESKLLSARSKEVILTASTLGAALRGGFRLIIATLGKDKVRLDITSNPKRILVDGTEGNVAQVQEILRNYESESLEAETADMALDNDEELCPVCWTSPEEPFKTQCGHVYCSSCISSQCTSATKFPIVCLGESATCNHPLSLSELNQVLIAAEHEALLQSSFTTYIRSHPNEFQYCPTPDCDRFYRPSSADSPRVFDCDGCLTSVCTGCQQLAHDGFSCAGNKAAREGLDELTKWKKENDVRDCPNCGVSIEKSYGCNHMECASCRTHICWFCMSIFASSSAVYGHMTRDHQGSWGL